MTRYNKLVRDKIPGIIRKKGGNPKYHIAGDDEYVEKLFEKIDEETAEFLEAKNEEELADLREVMITALDAMADHYGFDRKKVRAIQARKARERGRFRRRIILEEA